MPGDAEGTFRERHEQAAAILDAVRAIAGEALHAAGLGLRRPVAARFRTTGSGSTGVEVTVELADPAHAERAAAAIAERFGEPGPPDAITVR